MELLRPNDHRRIPDAPWAELEPLLPVPESHHPLGCHYSGKLGPILGALVWMAPVLGWAGAPKEAPDEARLREAEELKGEYERLYSEGEYARAAALAERACAILGEEHGSTSVEVAGCLNDLGGHYLAQGAYEKAEPLHERALAIREEALGPAHPDVARSLNELGVSYLSQGAHGKAEPLLELALAIFERALGPDHPDVGKSLLNLAELYRAQGAYGKAEPLYERALAILEKALGPDHPDVAHSLNNLALLYRTQGAYERAEPLYERALAIFERGLGPDHPDVALSLHNIAALYHARGMYGKAEPLHERALAIFEKGLGPDHPYVAASLHSLAHLYAVQGAYGTAEPLYERALAIREKALGPDHPHVAQSLNNLGLLYNAQGAYGRAEPLYERALAIYEKALGPDHPDVATSVNNLAFLYHSQGAYGKAEPLYERALAILEKGLSPDDPLVAKSLNNLASFYHDQGKHGPALRLRHRALDIEDTNLVRTLAVSDEPRRLAYASTLSISLYYALSLHIRANPEHDAIAELALTTLLHRKNRVQDLVTQSNAALRRSLPENDRHLLDDLSDVDSRIAALSSRGPGPLGIEAHAQQLGELRQERDRLWSELAKHSALVKALDEPITIENVQRTLRNGGALIELTQYVPEHGDDNGIRLRPHETKPPPRYAAYLVFPTHFDWVDLGPAAPIDAHVKAFRRALQAKQAIPTDLYDAVMRPIVDELGSARRLIIAPAGALSLIPFGALYDGERYLIEKYDLRYVTTGRDLLAPPTTPPVATTPVAIVANPIGAKLPDAEREADFVASVFPHARVLLHDEATETNVRTIDRPLVLHMATHGFFGDALDELDDPMLRSGLYLADVEKVKVDRAHDDGLLTAYEVSGMDLRGTQLVVLSACETGLGAAAKAEGKELMSESVFGLRRAFATAGARTMVMSLWEVLGVTAQKTMEAYYRKLAEGLGRGEAMQAVQLEMLRSEEHAHPKDWAAFIVSGDDTPMVFPAGQEPRLPEREAPPPVNRRRGGCSLADTAPDRDPLPPLFLGLLGLTRRRRP